MGNKTTVWDTFNYLGVFPIKKNPNQTVQYFPTENNGSSNIHLAGFRTWPQISGFNASQCTTAGNHNWTEASAAAQWLHHKPVLFLLLPRCLKCKKNPKQTTPKTTPKLHQNQPQKDPYSLRVSAKFKTARRTRQLQQHPSEPCKGLKKSHPDPQHCSPVCLMTGEINSLSLGHIPFIKARGSTPR